MDISHRANGERGKKPDRTSAAEHTVPFGKKAIQFFIQIHRVMEEISATDELQIEEISAAGHMEIEATSAAAESTESGERAHWPENSIFRAPTHIRYGRESYFEPKLVSIGPYYHGQENLKRMEDLKLRCVPEIREKQRRQRNHPRPLEAGIPRRRHSIYYVPVEPSSQGGMGIDGESLNQFIVSGRKARAFYKEEFDHSDEVEFVRMLVIDSCFIIRTILSLSQQVQESMAFLDVHIKEIRSDLFLLENQIPLFFIMEVYEWLFPLRSNQPFPRFNTVLEPFICLDMPWRINHDAMCDKAAHLLDLYWRCSLSPQMFMELTFSDRNRSEAESDLSEQIENRSNSSEQEQSTWAEIHLSNNALMVIANATELQKIAGIEFEKFKDKGHLDVIFSKGIMRMPRLKIDSRQIILLRNLIAFENCILPKMRIITCYMKLMDALIDTEKDVKLLQKCGVIYNTLSSHEMAATFFNDIGNFCFIDNNANPFSGLYKNVQEYYDSSWHRRWASLRHNYFNSPWAGISVVAAVILLILSVVDTFYNIYGYHYPKN